MSAPEDKPNAGLSEQFRARYQALISFLGDSPFELSKHYRAPLPEAVSNSLLHYLGLLERWTKRVDLVAGAASEVLLERHLIDCLAAGAICSARFGDGAVLDVGSGAGLPGLVWGIVEPQRDFLLCEPRERRAMFLKEACRRLALENVFVINERIENVSRETIPAVGILTARALGEEKLFLNAAATLLAPSGQAVLLAGPNWQETADARPEALSVPEVVDYHLAAEGPERKLVIWARAA